MAAAVGGALLAAPGTIAASSSASTDPAAQFATATPIKHVVVIYQENVSFDHYFGTYPHALNPAGEPPFEAAPDTPTVNGLCGPATGAPGPSPTNPPCDGQSALLTSNPNLDNPQRLDRSQALTCDMDHNYNDEQSAFDHGLLDMFVQKTSPFSATQNNGTLTCDAAQVMDYYDGNTVTALWNYAQHYAMSDNSYSVTFGPSTPGALNLISGNTFGAVCGDNPSQVFNSTACTAKPYNTAAPAPTPPQGTGTVFGDARPNFDKCSVGRTQAQMGGRNIGDLLNDGHLTWGWFQGGFAESCTKATPPTGGLTPGQNAAAANFDYIPHHEPFQYYASTANPNHLPPTSPETVGETDQANHQYDLTDFWAAIDAGNMPAVSFLKAAGYQDGHAGYSTPLDEQHFIVNTINRLEKTAFWHTTAVVIAYDDSDGWYDHQMGLIQVQSQSPWDTLSNVGQCGTNSNGHQSPPSATQHPASATLLQEARCGLGMRQPLLVISPFARHNFVDHTLTDQSSILRFIEDNWLGGERIGQGSTDAIAGTINNMFDFDNPAFERLFLDPMTGEKTGDD
jgi:phospholipase C